MQMQTITPADEVFLLKCDCNGNNFLLAKFLVYLELYITSMSVSTALCHADKDIFIVFIEAMQ